MTGLPSLLRLFPTRSRSSEKKGRCKPSSSPNLGNQQISVERCVFWEENRDFVLGDLIYFDFISTLIFWEMVCKLRKIVRITSPADMVGFMFLTELCQMQGFATCIHCEFANDATIYKKETHHMFILPYQITQIFGSSFWETKAMGCSTCCHIPPGSFQGSINTFMEKVLMAFPTSGSAKKKVLHLAAGAGCFQDFGGNTAWTSKKTWCICRFCRFLANYPLICGNYDRLCT